MMFLGVMIAALTAVFCLTVASNAWQDIVLGLVISTGLVFAFGRRLLPRPLPDNGYVLHIIIYLPVFLWMLFVDVVKGTLQVASIVIGLRPLEHPGIVRVPLGNHTQNSIGMVGLLVTISPGSFLVDVNRDENVMLVHYIDASNPEQCRADLEKYYRLWEYGTHIPKPSAASEEPT
jgi:multisubunit Na+/H+ antiporter MnhE subunit